MDNEKLCDKNGKICLKHSDIVEKIDNYLELFTKIKDEVLMAKDKANLIYSRLTIINNTSQCIIIGLSACVSLMQSMKNKNEYTDEDKYYMALLPALSGIIVALSRLFRIEDKKEITHNLRDRLFDLQGRIEYNMDFVLPWKNEEHYLENYVGKDGKNKLVEWTSLIEKIDAEYLSVIENKKELFSNVEKILEVTNKKYENRYNIPKIKNSSTQTVEYHYT